jgi:Zn-dependent peptidase ImmA (M78 family)
MTAIQDWMRDYLIDAGNEKLSFVGSCKNEKKVEKIAASIRNTINLDFEWYSNSKNASHSFDILRNYFESVGILIMKNGVVGQNNHRTLDIYEFRAFTLNDEYAPLVFINNNDFEAAKLFSLLHEIVHIWIGLHSFYNDSHGISFNISPRETICNAVAAEILIPAQVFIEKWNNNSNLSISENVENLFRYFKCGKAVILRKAFDNKLITENQYKDFTNEVIEASRLKNEKSKSGGNYYNTMISRFSKRFILALSNSINEGKTLFKEAHRLTGTNRETFNRFINEVREQINAQ